ncbi:hypothetical protein HN011_004918 [Eciton burchellii]|nr:hypothetical protein HN011_004918 [Eciton burchellii]
MILIRAVDPEAKAPLCEIAVSCPRIADRPADVHFRTRRAPRWTSTPPSPPAPAESLPDLRAAGPEEAPSRKDQGSAVRPAGTRRSPIRTRRPGPDIVGFELTGLSRIVLQQAIVPESSRNQASCLSVEKKNIT